MNGHALPQLHGVDDYELRVCVGCGRHTVRPYREDRHAELACGSCGGGEFTLYDPVWVRREPRWQLANELTAEEASIVLDAFLGTAS